MGTEKRKRVLWVAVCSLTVIAFLIPSTLAVAVGTNLSPSGTNQSEPRIAVVMPIFSATAYDSAFYVFYARYASSNQSYIRSDLNLLNVTVKFGWGWSTQLNTFLMSEKARQNGLVLGETYIIINEINVTEGGLFRNGKRLYDALILGFTEYVTKEEYSAYREFVASGGVLIIMDACNFLAEVKYYPPVVPGGACYLSLVKGHGWEFNGTCAWKSAYHRWYDENWNWIGSNYWHYWYGRHYDSLIVNTSNPISRLLNQEYGTVITTRYTAHEENLLQNFTNTEVIGYWHLINPSEYPGSPIAAYEHKYVNGVVFHAGIMASDIIQYDACMQTFLIAAVHTIGTDDTSLGVATIYALSAIGGVTVILLTFSVLDMKVRKRSKRNV